MSRKGMFGEIEVKDEGLQRSLFLRDQRQGGAYLRPSAASVAPNLPHDAPGPISSSAYPMGWMLAGLMNPQGSGLMVGLGSGAGAIQLLYSCPHVDLTIVEIDPVMVQEAINGFPLLVHYMDQGRLNIVIEDAEKYLRENRDRWDFGCADAYDGGQAIIDGYMPALCERCEHIYVNVIDRLQGRSFVSVVEVMEAHDQPVAEVFRAARYGPYTSRANWIITSQDPDFSRAANFVPFEDIDDVHALDAQLSWDNFITSALSVAA